LEPVIASVDFQAVGRQELADSYRIVDEDGFVS
jgi:hypothetical protein